MTTSTATTLGKVTEHVRVFTTGRPTIQAEIGKRPAGQVKNVFISTSKDDIIEYLSARLDENETLDAMDQSPEANIVIRENKSEM